jgi:hypothetical protein
LSHLFLSVLAYLDVSLVSSASIADASCVKTICLMIGGPHVKDGWRTLEGLGCAFDYALAMMFATIWQR